MADLKIADKLDADDQLLLTIDVYPGVESGYAWLNRDEAIDLSNHIQKLFELEAEQ